ncbi:hypothetical protein K2173_014868 [Erythroxylum novogranatense]|uniref:Uncharacterized protein n=1 Tax=Erythroxylum novogranatense TaxID=1862640 RepID=A0AAV8TFS5_9ROSI|nr:hypothetical protein K2173_014868 [Erythroxylum novogranatense]
MKITMVDSCSMLLLSTSMAEKKKMSFSCIELKRAEIWPYVPYNLVAQPYAAQSYDKKAPPGYVRKVDNIPTNGTVTRYEDPYITMFSDDNPNACSIM